MLVLSRKPGERIMIGDNITVTVVRIGPNNVRLGIDAPRHLNIVREELCVELPAGSALAGPVETGTATPSDRS
jgi:carbon storage regulator